MGFYSEHTVSADVLAETQKAIETLYKPSSVHDNSTFNMLRGLNFHRGPCTMRLGKVRSVQAIEPARLKVTSLGRKPLYDFIRQHVLQGGPAAA